MAFKFALSLFIFRRDLRLEDNTALNTALAESKLVIPCFIINPEQIGPQNKYRSTHALQFMRESLAELASEIEKKHGKLYLFHDTPSNTVEMLLHTLPIEAVYVNRDYTPYATKRDNQLENQCNKKGVVFNSYADVLLHEPEDIINKQGAPYKIFTPFFKASQQHVVAKPEKLHSHNFYKNPIKNSLSKEQLQALLPGNLVLAVPGGRKAGLKLLRSLDQFEDYERTHDILALDTTLLSAHNKFGTVSIRELYHSISDTLSPVHPLIRQLFWRDFFYHVAWHYPHVFGHAFYKQYDSLPWSNNKEHFERWCTGTTGFPIVDAGMRQLNETGYMHNRARLIVGSFLVKDLHINWQWGEQYFAQQLTDYDPAVNNGNWQWVASTGCDHQPYFRIFNPWLQQKKFDPECTYIKRWVPELKDFSPKTIHNWFNQDLASNNYPSPMIDHDKEADIAKAVYRRVASKR